MVMKIRPALTGLPTLWSALTAKARPRSVGSIDHSLGSSSQVASAQVAKPLPDRKKNELKSRSGPQASPCFAAQIDAWRQDQHFAGRRYRHGHLH